MRGEISSTAPAGLSSVVSALQPVPVRTGSAMDPSGGEVAAKRPSSGAREEDRISALPDDLLVLILLRLDTAADAGRTGVLSRRWRRVWKLLPELRFPADAGADPQRIRTALSAHGADLHCLHVGALNAARESVAAWLPLAAPRVSGSLIFRNEAPGRNADGGVVEKGALELPCFHRATTISLDLGFLGLAVPAAGVFARLTDLTLKGVHFHGPRELGDVVSSPRCPCLQNLTVDDAGGLLNLAIHSESLIELHLSELGGLRQFTLVAPALRKLAVVWCLGDRSFTNISAPQLETLQWMEFYDPNYVQLGEMTQLQKLMVSHFYVYARHYIYNQSVVELLKQIRFTYKLGMALKYHKYLGSFQYSMEDLTALPHLMRLTLVIINNGHTFGASVFHLLKMCVGLKELGLQMYEERSTCLPGCICAEPSNWKTEGLTLNCLQAVVIHDMKGTDHEVTFLKRLFNWATVLDTMRVTFHHSMGERRARELCHMISSFSRSEIHVEFCMHNDAS